MVVKKFEAPSLESALKLVKAELGPEALILSTQNRKGTLFRKASVEVTAAFAEAEKKEAAKAFDEEELARVFPHRRLEQALTPQSYDSVEAEREAGRAAMLRRAVLGGKAIGIAAGGMTDEKFADGPVPRRRTASDRPATYPSRRGENASLSTPRPDVTPQVRRLEKDWLDLGLQPETAAELAGRLVLDFGKSDRENPDFLAKVKAKCLAGQMRTLGPEVFESRRQWAVVGMPGAGKTTLLVKLGLFLKKGKQSVALVSCDRRKIIGRQELAAYAKLIRTPFSTEVKGDRPGAKVQLVDTPSFTHQNKEVMAEVGKICRDTNTLLVLDASQRLQELLRIVDRAASLAPMAIAFTRLDAIDQAGVIYEVLKTAKLPLLGASLSHAFSTPFRFFEPTDLARYIVNKGN